MLDWALATTYPNTEHRAAKALADRDLPFRFFKRRTLIAHRGILRERLVPAFPSYIFVPFRFCWDVVREIKDVIGVVMFENGSPAKVRQSVIDQLSSLCADDVLVEPPTKARFNAGDEVTVTSIESTFSQKGKYLHSCGDGRSIVLLDWMGRSVCVNVLECDLTEIAPSKDKGKRRRRRRRSRNRYTSPVQRSENPAFV